MFAILDEGLIVLKTGFSSRPIMLTSESLLSSLVLDLGLDWLGLFKDFSLLGTSSSGNELILRLCLGPASDFFLVGEPI